MDKILDDESIERLAKEVTTAKEKVETIQSEHVAYLLKNMNHIKNLIEAGQIKNDAESVQSSIKNLTNEKVSIELNKEIVSILSKNGIYTKQSITNRKCISEFFVCLVIIEVICAIIVGFIWWFSSYDIDFLKTFIFCTLISVVITLSLISD